VSDLFCRHNRFTADCPICSKGTLLDSDAARGSPRTSRSAPRRSGGKPAAAQGAAFRGPYATAGPYERDGERVEVRLEKVPGGVRLAEWAGGALRRRAPVLPAADLLALIVQARERELLAQRDLDALADAAAAERSGEGGEWGASPGRTADLQEELRVESLGDGELRVARWILRPGAGWELQDAPPMLPAARFADALSAARRAGIA
jgi:hypothetical protein